MKRLFVALFVFCSFNRVYCLEIDSASLNILKNFHLNISGNHISQFNTFFDNSEEVIVPKYFVENNKPDWVEVVGMTDDEKKYRAKLTDNPLIHGAAYIDFDLDYKSNGFSINTNLIAEHRGISYGVYNTNAMVLFPKYKIAYDGSFNLFNNKCYAGAFAGNYNNLKLYEGLLINNIDGQGMQTYLKWNDTKLCLNTIGDLTNWIGLNIDAAFNLILSFENNILEDNINFDAEIGGFNYLTGYGSFSEYDGNNNYGIDISFAVKNYLSSELKTILKEPKYNLLKVYSEYAYRKSDISNDFKSNSSFLVGFSFLYKCNKFKIDLCEEYRYYGKAFNAGFLDRSVYYRKMIEFMDTLGSKYGYPTAEYNNTIGDNLYPLYYYDRPFNQWAVYTRYEDLDVSNLILLAKINYILLTNFFVDLDLDINYIKADIQEAFFYPFYTLGLGYGVKDMNYISINITNKTMNLDLNYPTFYVSKSPILMLKFSFNSDIL